MVKCLVDSHREYYRLEWDSDLEHEAAKIINSGQSCDGSVVSDESDRDDDMAICVIVGNCDAYFRSRSEAINTISKENGEVGCSVMTSGSGYKVACVYEEDDK
ncbi:hypothetical protein ACHWQZ_G019452 [Mnemiopsis leidyi]